MAEDRKLPADKPLTADDRVGLNRFEFDEKPFIVVDTATCRSCATKPCLYVCPSQVYRLDRGELAYDIEGCVELGACVVVCHHLGAGAIRWSFPRGGHGVEFRYG